ncbi:MAG: hypothetical protein V5A37_06595, partial [Halobacteriales archaeon]
MSRDSARDGGERPGDERDDGEPVEGKPPRDEASADGWPVLDSDVAFECPWFAVGYDRVRRPDGETAEYYWIDPPD